MDILTYGLLNKNIEELRSENFNSEEILAGVANQIQIMQSQLVDYAKVEEVSELREDLEDLQSAFEHEVNTYNNECSIIRYNTPNNTSGNIITGLKQFFDFGENATLSKIKTNVKASNDDTLVCDILTLEGTLIISAENSITTTYSDIIFEFQNLTINEPICVSIYTKNNSLLSYGAYGTPYEDTDFIYVYQDGNTKFAFRFGSTWGNIVNCDRKQCLVLFFDYEITILNSVSESIRKTIDSTLTVNGKSADAKVVGDKIKALENHTNVTTLYVSPTGNDTTGDGTEQNPYKTIYHANETITDNSEQKRYRIIVKQGTYIDLQERYAGVDGTYYQGVICKSFVTYQSEDINRPVLCVLEWDGSVGYEKPVIDANCVNKCIFHIKDNTQGVYIKGFTFRSKNTRYCMHIETVGATKECDWHFENCVFEWGGRPDEDDDGTVARACVGTGYSMLEYGEFINCIFKCTNTNSANHMIFQSHDNTDTDFSSIKRGEHIKFENCYFSVADGSTYGHFDLRQTKTSPLIKSFVEFINCTGLPVYVPSDTYNKHFVCTEQHT